LALNAALVLATIVGCAPRGSSFETLGVPAAGDLERRGALVVGWAREARGGWRLTQVRVDDRVRDEWAPAAQRPVVIGVEPGRRRLQVRAIRAGDGGARSRVKLRPVEIDVAVGQVRLCVLDVDGGAAGGGRPRVRCPLYLGPDLDVPPTACEPVAATSPDDAPGHTVTGPDQHGASGAALAVVLERLDRIERALAALSAPGADASPPAAAPAAPAAAERQGLGTKLRIDTEFPWGEREAVPPRDRFDRTFERRDERPGRGARPR
jgi:hypothetical protein